MLDKAALLDSLRSRVSADLEALERRQRETQEGATHAEARAEHSKDTRATEQGYLARGLAGRVEDVRRTRAALNALDLRSFAPGDAIAVSAFVVLESESDESDAASENWLVVPAAGGVELEQAGTRVRTVTPSSPLGRSLLGLCEGDAGTVRMPRGERSFEILRVR